MGPLGPAGPVGADYKPRRSWSSVASGIDPYEPIPEPEPQGFLDGVGRALGGVRDFLVGDAETRATYGDPARMDELHNSDAPGLFRPTRPGGFDLSGTGGPFAANIGAAGTLAPDGSNILLEEALRPLNYVPGLNLARGLSFAPKASAGVRIAAEVAAAAAGRKAAEETEERLPEDMNPVARGALTLGAGLVAGGAGGAATARGLRGAGRAADDFLGEAARETGDVTLNARIPGLPGPVTARVKQPAEAGTREGSLLRLRGMEQLGPDATVSDVIGVANDAKRQVGSNVVSLMAEARNADDALGPTLTDAAGNIRLRNVIKADGAPALKQDVLENPARYPLTPEQQQAVQTMQSVAQRVRAEATGTGLDLRTVGLEEGQSYFPRLAAQDTKGATLKPRGGGGGQTLRTQRDQTRIFADPLEATANGVVYQDPVEALSRYVMTNLKGAGDKRVGDMLKTFGETAADRRNAALVNRVSQLRSQISQRIQTLGNQGVRGSAQADEARRADTIAARINSALERSRARREGLPTADEARAASSEARALLREAQGRAQRLSGELRAKQIAERGRRAGASQAEREVAQALSDMDSAIAHADELTGREGIRRFGGEASELPPEMAHTVRATQGEYRDSLRAADRLSRSVDRLGDVVATRQQALEAAGIDRSTVQEMLQAARQDIATGMRETATDAETRAAMAGAQRELRVMEIQARQAERRAIAAGDRSAATLARQDATQTEIESLRGQLDDLKDSYDQMIQRTNQVPAGRARVNAEAAPMLMGTDFAEKDARRINRFYANGILPDNALGNTIRGANQVNRKITPMRAIGDASAVLRQLALVLPSHPIEFAKNFGLAARDLVPGGTSRYRAWLSSPEVRSASAHGVSLLGDGGAANSDLWSSWLSHFPVLAQTQKHFEMITNRNRVDIWKQDVDMLRRTGQRVDDEVMEQVGRNANRITGVSNAAATDAETFAEFAANWMRARLETLSKATTDGGIEGSLARQYLNNYVSTGLIGATAVAVAQGRDPREVLSPVTVQNGRVRYNPNFGTVRVGDVDFDLFGTFSDLARMAIVAGDGVNGAIQKRDAAELVKGIWQAAESKGSVLAGTARDLAALALGNDVFGENPNDAMFWATRLGPISASTGIDAIQDGQSPGQIALGQGAQFFGGKANAITPAEAVDAGKFDSLSPTRQLAGYRAQSWQETTRAFGGSVGDYKSFSAWRTAQVDDLYKDFRKTMSEAAARKLAEDTADKLPIAKAYSEIKNAHEDMWGLQHPQEAAKELDRESRLPERDRYFNPKKDVRAFIEASR